MSFSHFPQFPHDHREFLASGQLYGSAFQRCGDG
jgi:hypothetical protein